MVGSCDNVEATQDAVMLKKPKFDRSKQCVKCKIETGNVVVRHSVYCKTCYLPLFTGKFRKCVEPHIQGQTQSGKSRRTVLKASGNLCIGLSGGLGSTVLLDLVHKCYFQGASNLNMNVDTVKGIPKARGGSDHPRNQNAWRKGYVCYVEPSSAFPHMEDRTEQIRNVVAKYDGLEFVPVRLEDAFDHDWWEKVGGSPLDHNLRVDLLSEDLAISDSPKGHASPLEHLKYFISSLPTPTAIPTALANLVRMVLLYTARSLGASHLLLGTSLTTLSISLISTIGQGGGFGVKEEVSEVWLADDSSTPVQIVRPLREAAIKECGLWSWWSGLQVVGRDKYFGARSGIGVLTSNFIINLEKDYPSTVSTIARTCGKLVPNEIELPGQEGVAHCVLCERPSQPGIAQHWRNQISLKVFDASIHPHAPPSIQAFLLSGEDIEDAAEPSAKDSSSASSIHLARFLCYACHTTLTSRSGRGAGRAHPSSTDIVVPVWVQTNIRHSESRTTSIS